MRAAIYKTDSGLIVRRVTAPASMIDVQCEADEDFYLNCPDTATHIVNNEPVTIVPEPTLDEIRAKLETAVTLMLDRVAKANGNWGSINNAVGAAGRPGRFQAQAETLAQYWEDVWDYCYQVLDDVDAGRRPVPTEAELLAELPQYQP